MSCIECWKYKTCKYRLGFNMNENVGCIEFEKEPKVYTLTNSLTKEETER